MADLATFTGPHGADPRVTIRREVAALSTVTTGDLLYLGQGYRGKIRERTFAGIDVHGAAFAPYSTKGPYYLYPNREATGARSVSGDRSFTASQLNARRDKARATASKNRHAKTGRIGVRTATGIKYESYAAAKAAHGSGVNLFGMEQHPHMLDAMLVKAGGSESTMMDAEFSAGGSDEFSAFESNQPCSLLTIGFYGVEAERAKGNNEGTSKVPKREFFALNDGDLQWGEKAIGERMVIRARAGR